MAAALAAVLSLAAAAGAPPDSPAGSFDRDAPLSAGLGVNIHFTHAPSQEADLLAEGGFRWIRMDFGWASVEREPGTYRFDPYDDLYREMTKRNVRCLFILDYGHPVHTKGLGPADAAGRAAYARFAGAAASHFRGRRVVWEIWNEPNIEQFWKPRPSAADYTTMALEAIAAIRTADPQAAVIAPATSTIDLTFLEECFRRGLLERLDAVSVHPYRGSPPESAAPELARLSNLIERYLPSERRPGQSRLPIVSGEWGYSTANIAPEEQARFLVRQQLLDRALGLPFSIWYDWKDDGPDPKENEHRFGTVGQDLAPKPAYRAIRALAEEAGGLTPRGPVELGDGVMGVLLLDGHRTRALAAWSPAGPRRASIAIGAPAARVRRIPGAPERVAASGGILEGLALDGMPAAIVPEGRSDLLEAWGAVLELGAEPVPVRAGRSAHVVRVLRNPLARELSGRLSLEAPPGVTGRIEPAEVRLAPGKSLDVALSFELTSWIDGERQAAVHLGKIEGPWIEGLWHGGAVLTPMTLLLDPGLTVVPSPIDPVSPRIEVAAAPWMAAEPAIAIPTSPGGALPPEGLRVEVRANGLLFQRTYRAVPLDPTSLRAELDGDAKVEGESTLEAAGRGLRVRYRFGAGWKFLALAPKGPLPVVGKPAWIVLRARGTGDDTLRVRLADAAGQTFQATLGTPGREWTVLRARIDDGSRLGHWGGPKDGVMRPPLRLEAPLLIDSSRRVAHEGDVVVEDLQLLSDE